MLGNLLTRLLVELLVLRCTALVCIVVSVLGIGWQNLLLLLEFLKDVVYAVLLVFGAHIASLLMVWLWWRDLAVLVGGWGQHWVAGHYLAYFALRRILTEVHIYAWLVGVRTDEALRIELHVSDLACTLYLYKGRWCGHLICIILFLLRHWIQLYQPWCLILQLWLRLVLLLWLLH